MTSKSHWPHNVSSVRNKHQKITTENKADASHTEDVSHFQCNTFNNNYFQFRFSQLVFPAITPGWVRSVKVSQTTTFVDCCCQTFYRPRVLPHITLNQQCHRSKHRTQQSKHGVCVCHTPALSSTCPSLPWKRSLIGGSLWPERCRSNRPPPSAMSNIHIWHHTHIISPQ